MDIQYPGIGLVIEKQCPWCSNTRTLVQQEGHDVRFTCTMNGNAPTRKLPPCGYTALIPKKMLTKEEAKRFGIRFSKVMHTPPLLKDV